MGRCLEWVSREIEFINDPPVITSFTVEPTRQLQNGKFVGNVSAKATDPDGDSVTLEWDGDYRSDGLYERGKVHRIRVRSCPMSMAQPPSGVKRPWSLSTRLPPLL